MNEATTSVHPMNINNTERLISVLCGSALLIDGLLDRKLRWFKLAAGGYLFYRGATGNCAILNAMGARGSIHTRNTNIRTVIHVDRPRSFVYEQWRNLQNLPHFMEHIESVTPVYDDITEWKANPGRFPFSISWKARIIKDIPGEMLSWESLPDSDIYNAGKVEFRDGLGSSTDIHVIITYRPPFGLLGEAAAELLKPSFRKLIFEDVNNFRNYIEDKYPVANVTGLTSSNQ